MQLPKRAAQHVSETASYKLFSYKVPNRWIVRDVSERDYGIDCYLELVNENEELSGDLTLIQLKSRDGIPWTKEKSFRQSDINVTTSNYWFGFAVPVFIFLTDIKNNEIFFVPVKHYIRKNFRDFNKQQQFTYQVEQRTTFEGEQGVRAFLAEYYRELNRRQFKNELLFFLSSLPHFKDFQADHFHGDFHLGIEDEDLVFFEAMHRNYAFLSAYFEIRNPIPSIKRIKENSHAKFKSDVYELLEHDLTEWVTEFQQLTPAIIRALQAFVESEEQYWIATNLSLFRYINDLDPDAKGPYG